MLIVDRKLLILLRMSLKFDSVLESATMDQHFFLTFVDLFRLLLGLFPMHALIHFPGKTSGLSDSEADRVFLFKLLLPPLLPLLAAPLQCGRPNGPDVSG